MDLNSGLRFRNAFGGTYRGKRVLVTGHTGFKGSWLSEWLLQLGAEVTGFALPPPTTPALFDQLGLARRLRHVVGDIRDLETVKRVVIETKPDFVFHLAAQPLVRLSYEQPVETYATNVMGTVNVLEALRCFQNEVKSNVEVQVAAGPGPAPQLKLGTSTPRSPCIAVMITTDKCYENKEWVHSYREDDPLGGYDPYSSSKGAAELVIAAYRRSFFQTSTPQLNSGLLPVRVASARAGNVIGGGDWALDRIVPDCIRSLQRGEAIPVRNRVATRPWQHVLEPLSGYLLLASAIATRVEAENLRGDVHSGLSLNGQIQPAELCSAFNFGPALTSNRTVADLVQEILKHWQGSWADKSDPHAVHEAKLLNLSTDKAHHFLGWQPVWNFPRTVECSAVWYRTAQSPGTDIRALTREQIAGYMDDAAALHLPWTQ